MRNVQARCRAGSSIMIRPKQKPAAITPTLAVGADLKNACCVGEDRYAWLSQHIGDMDDIRSVDTLDHTAAHLQMLTGVRPNRLVSDRLTPTTAHRQALRVPSSRLPSRADVQAAA